MAAEQQNSADPTSQADTGPDADSAQAGPDADSAEAGADADSAIQADPNAADVKAKFRDALERKRNQHADGVGTSGPGSSKIQDVHSRAGGKRQFRRKSGG